MNLTILYAKFRECALTARSRRMAGAGDPNIVRPNSRMRAGHAGTWCSPAAGPKFTWYTRSSVMGHVTSAYVEGGSTN